MKAVTMKKTSVAGVVLSLWLGACLTACKEEGNVQNMEISKDYVFLRSGDEVVGVLKPGVVFYPASGADFSVSDPGDETLRKIFVRVDYSDGIQYIDPRVDREEVIEMGGARKVSNMEKVDSETAKQIFLQLPSESTD